MGSQSVEPGFRVYGKNQAAKELHDMAKVKQKIHLGQITTGDQGLNSDFSFRTKTGGHKKIASPRNELVTRSYNRDHQA